MLAGRAVTLRSARLPRHMAVEEEELALAQQLQALAGVAAVSVRRALLHPHQVHMAQEAEAVALPPQASML